MLNLLFDNIQSCLSKHLYTSLVLICVIIPLLDCHLNIDVHNSLPNITTATWYTLRHQRLSVPRYKAVTGTRVVMT